MTAPEAVEPLPFIDGIVYGEGPRWHDGRLWFSDGPAGKVYSAGESGDLAVEAEVEHASGLGWLPDGTLVVSALFEAKIYHVDVHGAVSASYDLSDVAFSTNDLLVTSDGRGYVDLYATEGCIGLVLPDGTVRIVATGISLPNGLGLLPDGSTVVVSDTNAGRILAYPCEPDGSLGAPGVFADLGPERHPDGLCVDVEGRVWIGCYDTGEFLRVVGRRHSDPPRRDRPWMGGRAGPRWSRWSHAVHGCRRHHGRGPRERRVDGVDHASAG